MKKVTPSFAFTSSFQSTQRRCRICGNAYLAMSMNTLSCEFCKTPFAGTVTGMRSPATGLMASSFSAHSF